MDAARAKRFAKELNGETVAGWKIQECINWGKSAVVFKGQKESQVAAIKFFDPELVDRYSVEVQEQRIEREKSLIGKKHPNLVEIFDGGYWKGKGLFYVVMEFLPWKNLAEVLADVPIGRERSLIAQVASAARFLEGLDISHRDIKPENIGISPDFQTAKLLDLGVIKPQGSKPITDEMAKNFVGTIKYSPPEFLLREEENTPEGWRAVTFYQLGAVLHDLITRRSLFADFETPPARLINAVQHETAAIKSTAVSQALVELARYCLLKKPTLRLDLVTWGQFEQEPVATNRVAELKSRILKRQIVSKDSLVKEGETSAAKGAQRLDEYSRDLQTICRLESVENASIFPPVEILVLEENETAHRIAVQYEPSTSRGLLDHCRVELAVRWLDQPNNVIEVTAAAFVSSNAFSTVSQPSKQGVTLFRGIYASETVRRKVSTALYAALDHAQEGREPQGIWKKRRKNKHIVEINLGVIE